VLRVYEPHGASGVSTLTFDRPVKSATFVNILEEDLQDDVEVDGNSVNLDLRPWELVSSTSNSSRELHTYLLQSKAVPAGRLAMALAIPPPVFALFQIRGRTW
jgi:hypothetical protein